MGIFYGTGDGECLLGWFAEKLISKGAEMLSVDIWEPVRACSGKIGARD